MAPQVLATPRDPAHNPTEDTVDSTKSSASAHDSRTERLTREARGIALFEERGHDIQQLARGLYSVPSCTVRKGDYLVRYDDQGERCECRDFEFGHVCKHLYAAALFAAKRRKAIRSGFAPALMPDGR